MTKTSLLSQLPGGNSVIEYFGREPKFHDAEITSIHLAQGAPSRITLHAWNTTNAIDSKGYFLTDKHALVEIEFLSIDRIELSDFDIGHTSIVFSLEFTGSLETTEVSWTSSVGAEGRIVGKGVSISISPRRTDGT
ncbi:immunity 50 family protein [Aliiroseovarius crassostreae]|uniref:immunity 50 family protein n=1 Tax=Aliiroseovarius crassostreae TaxID=154981 RepID=UPI002204F777|nr:immunity 50 family protein [Aliiroseovarius crassostreae]UWP91175.1 immunity 50 family protein [Aliiroseovarius crassostreae]